MQAMRIELVGTLPDDLAGRMVLAHDCQAQSDISDQGGLVCSIACWAAPPSPLMTPQASLFGSGAPLDSPHSLWDLASTTPEHSLELSLSFHPIEF